MTSRRLLLLLLLLPAASAPAQDAAFAWVEVRAAGAANVVRGALDDAWQAGPQAELSAETPFYLGRAGLGVSLQRFESRRPGTVPTFDALQVFARWGLAAAPAPWLQAYAGARLGNHRLTFDEDTFPGSQNESELLLGAEARLEVRLSPAWTLYGAASFQQTYTFERMKLAYAGGGLAYRFGAPPWLQEFLR